MQSPHATAPSALLRPGVLQAARTKPARKCAKHGRTRPDSASQPAFFAAISGFSSPAKNGSGVSHTGALARQRVAPAAGRKRAGRNAYTRRTHESPGSQRAVKSGRPEGRTVARDPDRTGHEIWDSGREVLGRDTRCRIRDTRRRHRIRNVNPGCRSGGSGRKAHDTERACRHSRLASNACTDAITRNHQLDQQAERPASSTRFNAAQPDEHHRVLFGP